MAWRAPSLQDSPTLRYTAAFYLYVMQGIPAGFSLTAVANHLAAAGVSPPAIGQFVAAAGLPWTAQFVWGPVIDRFQRSPMGRRRPWVLLSQALALVASLGLLLVRDPVAQLGALTAAFCVHSVFASVQDASVDAMMISAIPVAERGRVNACMRGGMLFGTGVGAAALSSIMHRGGFFQAALAQSLVLLVLTAVTFFVKERAEDALFPWQAASGADARSVRQHPSAPPALPLRAIFAELFRGLLAARSVRVFGAILCVYLAASVFIRAFSIHLIQRLGWKDTAVSVLTGTYGMLVALGAVAVAGLLADRIGRRRLLMATMVVIGGFLVAFNLLAPWWADRDVARAGLIVWYTFDPTFSVAAMPLLMALCRVGVEGSQFTTYMALVNLADVAGAYLSGQALAVASAPAIGLACGAAVLAALVVVRRALAGVE